MIKLYTEPTTRFTVLQSWLQQHLKQPFDLAPLFGDASFRRYFRVQTAQRHYIVMDAPPEQEPCYAFIAIANGWRKLGVRTPEIFAQDLQQGFLLLTDFGDTLLLNILNAENVGHFYTKAFMTLLTLQACERVEDYALPEFSEVLCYRELQLSRDWYFTKKLGVDVSRSEHKVLEQAYHLLTTAALSQPQICVHRDYHSRNLIVCEDGEIGVLDFQDAVRGPVTYDVLSLLRDCYIDWPKDWVQKMALQFQQLLLDCGLLKMQDEEQFLRWFDWMGLQRHLKCLGIFSRLHLRDGKPGYLKDIPRVLHYAQTVCERYPEFHDLGDLLAQYTH